VELVPLPNLEQLAKLGRAIDDYVKAEVNLKQILEEIVPSEKVHIHTDGCIERDVTGHEYRTCSGSGQDYDLPRTTRQRQQRAYDYYRPSSAKGASWG
jgi:hypothetical protein